MVAATTAIATEDFTLIGYMEYLIAQRISAHPLFKFQAHAPL
jgi:hypothetical protein